MKFTAEIKGPELHITVKNEIVTHDCDMTKLTEVVKKVVNAKAIVIDLKHVKSAGSALINALVMMKKETKSQIVVRNANEELLHLLEVIGLYNFLKVEECHS
jgi:anti-anti-sigma regulatory factor